MKRIIAALLCIAALITNAQEASENLTIGIFPVTATDPAAKKYSAQIHSAISNVFAGKKRFTVVDRTKLDQLTAERDLQKQEDFLEGFVVEQGKSLGAQYLIQGNINQASAQSV
ncbi:MAG: hypothetical protein IPN22_04065 [Bacteroidetes bacterium]|nr:hypothetical protein [Bacteroidota bacterium]